MVLGTILSVLAYLVGSLSSAVLVARVFGLPDPRLTGSGNPGATNILRIGGKLPAAVTIFGDMLKGMLPVALAAGMGMGTFGLATVGLAAFLGHIFPIFFHFRGGKGVATMFGVYLAAFPVLAVVMAVVWLVTAAAFRYSSLASLVAAIIGLLGTLLFHANTLLPILAMTVVLVIRHLDNIQLLRIGVEGKIEL